MEQTLIIAITFISAACILYTLGVWAEKISRRLKIWHAVVFWLGFTCDTIGTGAMGKLVDSQIQFLGLDYLAYSNAHGDHYRISVLMANSLSLY